MNIQQIEQALKTVPFRPFAVVTAGGDRFEVHHPELALVTRRALYVFSRTGEGDRLDDPTVISHAHVTALVPLPGKAA